MISLCNCQSACRTDVITPPTGLAISLEFSRLQAGYETTDTSFDDLFNVYIPAAAKRVEDWTGRTLLTTGFKAYWNGFPCCFKIMSSPNFTVTEIKYLDVDEAEQVLSSDEYLIYTGSGYAGIMPESAFPITAAVPDSVMVSYTAGYGAAETDIPPDIKLALGMMVTSMLANRGDCSDGCGNVPCAVQSMLIDYRVITTMNPICA